jgi:integrase/recombinase XerD
MSYKFNEGRRSQLASIASLFEYLGEKSAVTHNPVKGVERPKAEIGQDTDAWRSPARPRHFVHAAVSSAAP